MKIILTGTTGFIGTEILRQCLLSPRITSVVALVRREMQDQTHSKLKQVIMSDDDFLSYPTSLKKDIEGADGCIWALGSARFDDVEIMRRVCIDYNKAAASEFASAAITAGKKVQFVYLSGGLAVRDQSKSLWIKDEFRKARGYGEKVLVEKAEEMPHAMSVTIARPLGVLARNNLFAGLISTTGISIKVDELAAVLIEFAMNGSDQQTLENAALLIKGRALLKK